MSDTPKVQVWTGFFSKSGSPALKISLHGPFGTPVEFEGILDTGFTGFVSVPLLSALPLGLLLFGTASIELADGSKCARITAQGSADIHGESEIGVIILEPNSNDVLIGMAFLRLFKRALFVSQGLVLLVDETRTPDEDIPIPGPAEEQGQAPPSQDATS